MNTKKIKFDHFIYIAFAIFYFWLASQIPYTHDDWDWGLDVGMQQWLTASVNSRYVGNFFEVVMTRSEFLKTIIMGGAFFLLPYLLSSISAKSTKTNHTKVLLFLAANILILTMSRLIWSETYGWVAGFANFGLSAIFALLCLSQWLKLCKMKYVLEMHSFSTNILWLVIGFCGQLFIENLSIIMAAASLLACAASYIRAKKIPSHFLCIAVGTTLGLFVMFSSSVYSTLFGTGEAVDGYRQLIISGESGLSAKLYNLFVQGARLATRAGETNFVLCITVLLVLVLRLWSSTNISHKTKTILICINAAFAAYFSVNFILQTDYTFDRPILAAFAAVVNALYFIWIPIEAIIIYKGNLSMQSVLSTIWFFGVGLLVPLLVTNEAGYRLIFSVNIMGTLFVLMILQDILGYFSKINAIKAVLTICAVIPAAVCFVVYSGIGSCNNRRLELIEQAAKTGTAEIVLPEYPYQNYLHAPDPIDDVRMSFFKDFYGIDSDVTVIINSLQ